MARALWKGIISFGLVSIPVELHRAIRDTRPRFRLLHAKDKTPIRVERVCQRDGQPVAWGDLVKGYEYEKGQFIALTREDIESAALEKTNTVEILDFVEGDQIDDRFFETPYYLVPGQGGERAYAVLREAIRRAARTGISKIILRERQHLAALEAIGPALVLTLMRFPDELVDLSTLRLPEASAARGKEIEMAQSLVAQFAGDWSPEKYTDEYQANLMRVIRAKLKGTRPRLKQEPDERAAEVVDLMTRLRESLDRRSSAGRPAGPPRSRRTRKPASRRRGRAA
jgi:DNA end-binding protein Ku